MRFEDVLAVVGDEPVFETGLLLAGDVDANDVRRQLSRWTAAGRIWQVRRGLYALAPPYQKVSPHPFLVANRIVRGSYVSLQSALAFHGLILEGVPVVTSVTVRRGGTWTTPLGTYHFRNIHPRLRYGYSAHAVTASQWAFVAKPEKALLDLVHLEPGGDTLEYLDGLRLQHLDRTDHAVLEALAVRSGSPKLRRAVGHVARIAEREAEEYAPL